MDAGRYLDVMLAFVRKAGAMALDYMADSAPGLKPDQTVITRADRNISLMAREFLAPYLTQPGHILVDEEDPNAASYLNPDILHKTPFLWSVDPIDGTRVYANRMPTFGISLGLLKDLKPWLGVVYFPVLDELFYSDGQAAYFVSQAFSLSPQKTRIVPVDEEIGPRSIFFCNDTFFRKFNWEAKDFHIMINACAIVNLCWPAIGRGVGCFLRSHLWDFAGSWPIVKAAGMDFRSVASGKILEQIHVSQFNQGAKPWELSQYYLICSPRNYDVIKSKIVLQKDYKPEPS